MSAYRHDVILSFVHRTRIVRKSKQHRSTGDIYRTCMWTYDSDSPLAPPTIYSLDEPREPRASLFSRREKRGGLECGRQYSCHVQGSARVGREGEVEVGAVAQGERVWSSAGRRVLSHFQEI